MKAAGFITISGIGCGLRSRSADTRGHEGAHALGTLDIVFLALDKEVSELVVVAVVSLFKHRAPTHQPRSWVDGQGTERILLSKVSKVQIK